MVVARYRPGRMIYEIRDALLGKGTLTLELLTANPGSGLLLKAQSENIPAGVSLAWAFAGASGRKGRRNGDIGCEVQPVAQFFQVRAEECNDNRYWLDTETADSRPASRLSSPAGELLLTFPEGSTLQVQSFDAWGHAPLGSASPANAAPQQPILAGSCKLTAAAQYLTVQVIEAAAHNEGHGPGCCLRGAQPRGRGHRGHAALRHARPLPQRRCACARRRRRGHLGPHGGLRDARRGGVARGAGGLARAVRL